LLCNFRFFLSFILELQMKDTYNVLRLTRPVNAPRGICFIWLPNKLLKDNQRHTVSGNILSEKQYNDIHEKQSSPVIVVECKANTLPNLMHQKSGLLRHLHTTGRQNYVNGICIFPIYQLQTIWTLFSNQGDIKPVKC
jgi:hypothetical protein